MTFPVADVIAQIKREIVAAQNTSGASVGLKLDKIELEFGLTRTTDASGKASVGIPVMESVEVAGSGSRRSESTSSLKVELIPPESVGTMSGTDTTNFGITQAIIETRKQLLAGLNDAPKLMPNKVTITLHFVVTRSGGGTGEVKFLVFTAEGDVTLTSENSNSITLTFSKAKL